MRASLLAIAVTGCAANPSDAADAAKDYDVVPAGIIDWNGESEDILALPAGTLEARVSFAVTVDTYGGGCESAHSMEVTTTGDGAELRPLDRTFIPAGHGCVTLLQRLPHDGTLLFETPGEKVITIVGRRVTGSGIDEATERHVTILIE